MRAKKALFLATVGGFVTQFEMNNVSLLQQAGYEVHSAANYREPVYQVKEKELRGRGVILHQVDIEKSPFMWRENLRAFRQLSEIVSSEQIRLVHCHTPVGGVLGRLLGCRFARDGLKVVYTAHGFHFYKGAPWKNWLFYYTVERMLAHFTDALITINEEDYSRAKGFVLRSGGRVYRIPGEGLQRDAFQPVSRECRKLLRQVLGLEEGDFFLLSVGELSGNKNHEQVIRQFPEVQRRLNLQGRRAVYGICGDGFYREKLEGLIENLGLSRDVTIYGYCENVADYLACADCLVFPSIREGLGMAVLEAMSMGVPVAAADNRGTREYMEDGVNGFVFRTGDPEGLVQAVEKAAGLKTQELASMQKQGSRTVQRFEIKNTDRVMAQVYEALDAAICAEADTEALPGREGRSDLQYLSSKEGSMRKAQ